MYWVHEGKSKTANKSIVKKLSGVIQMNPLWQSYFCLREEPPIAWSFNHFAQVLQWDEQLFLFAINEVKSEGYGSNYVSMTEWWTTKGNQTAIWNERKKNMGFCSLLENQKKKANISKGALVTKWFICGVALRNPFEYLVMNVYQTFNKEQGINI